ncbi:MAG: cadmium-translocating P-type ATPase [Verrucomicrobiota bacterium]|nr:cadmium-translocating P-type ATPase [Verrucomicrobiota bacterium]
MRPHPFDEFFASGKEESVSPFLTPDSRSFGRNLPLKAALSGALFWIFAFGTSFTSPSLSSLSLTCVYFFVGTRASIGTLQDLKNFEINIDLLMTLAAFIALFLGSGLEGGLLLVLFELSQGMENAVTNKAKGALHHLRSIIPTYATLLTPDNLAIQKSVREIKVGEKLLVKAGEVVPLDGKIIAGRSLVHLAHLTGESRPISKGPDDAIVAGAHNLDAALTIIVERQSGDSTLTTLVRLITEASEAKPRVQRFLDRFGKRYATSIISLTLFFALFLPLLFSQIGYLGREGGIYRALAFLIAASPCALIIATPTAYLSAISVCARRGILLKGGVILDALASCKQIAFDKTGTLTTGELSCQEIIPIGTPRLSPQEALRFAYSLEREVTHPISRAICQAAAEKKLSPLPVTSLRAIPGFGIEGQSDNMRLAFGLPQMLSETLPSEKKEAVLRSLSTKGLSALLLVGEDLFLFRFNDTVRREAKELLSLLKQKFTTFMLTGDQLENAEEVGRAIGIDQIFANLRPEEKLAKIGELMEKAPLAMVGDGINDAPSLARATVGISMGKVGSGIAVDASDVVLLSDELGLLPWLFQKARKTERIVKQNIIFALTIICTATLPSLLGWLPLWAAVLLHEGGTLLVGCNSLRLYTQKN